MHGLFSPGRLLAFVRRETTLHHAASGCREGFPRSVDAAPKIGAQSLEGARSSHWFIVIVSDLAGFLFLK